MRIARLSVSAGKRGVTSCGLEPLMKAVYVLIWPVREGSVYALRSKLRLTSL